MLKTDNRWKEYLDAIESIPGLKKGADFGDIDHNELHIKSSWLVVKEVRDDTGLPDAMDFISRRVMK